MKRRIWTLAEADVVETTPPGATWVERQVVGGYYAVVIRIPRGLYFWMRRHRIRL
jgi:hypothetical protein